MSFVRRSYSTPSASQISNSVATTNNTSGTKNESKERGARVFLDFDVHL